MKKNGFSVFSVVLILSFLLAACDAPVAPSSPEGASLWIVEGSNAKRALGDGTDGLLLAQWAKKNNVSLYVQGLSGPEALELKDQTLKGAKGPDVFIFDDGVYSDGLYNTKSIATSAVGLWVLNTISDQLDLVGNTIPFGQAIDLMDSGKLSTVAGNADKSTPSAEFFYAVMAYCSNKTASTTATLTPEIVQSQTNRECGKAIYDHIKTTASTTDAIDLVFNAAMNDQGNAYNAVIAFDSSFLGAGGRNEQLSESKSVFMKFYYFKEATPVVSVTFGSVDVSKDPNKAKLVASLSEFLLGDQAQKAFNLAGLGNGSSTLATPDDSAFNTDWGVTMNPSAIVNIVNPPVATVAFSSLEAYKQFYKRTKELYICLDVSGSTKKVDPGNDGPRLQLIDRTVVTFTDPNWQTSKKIYVGDTDKINYYLFSTTVSPKIAESVGKDTKPAGDAVNALIGPATGMYVFDGVKSVVQDKYPGFEMVKTSMFDCAEQARKNIETRYNPNIDYYIIILTDGGRTSGISSDELYQNWLAAGHKNIVVSGIQFGNEGNDLNKDVTGKFNGKSYTGSNDAELIKAFLDIFSN